MNHPVPAALLVPLLGLAAALGALAPAQGSTPVPPAPVVERAAPTGDARFAPVDRPGPALRPSPAQLRRSVRCHGDFTRGRQAVLIVPGTAFTVATQFRWSWGRVLSRAGIPWCGVTPPQNSLGDLTVAGEYDVHAIRHTFRRSGGRPIAIVGHSQGGMRPRFALRFWPDVRAMVADMVGVAPDNRGITLGTPDGAIGPLGGLACLAARCPQGLWQQFAGSRFLTALNSRRETFAGIDYSVIYSRTDGAVMPRDTVLRPAPGTSYRRVAVQDVCPARIADHLTNGTTDAVALALLLDAVTHRGPVDPARLDRGVCGQLLDPRIDSLEAAAGAAGAPGQIARALATTPRAAAEAPLPAYVFAR